MIASELQEEQTSSLRTKPRKHRQQLWLPLAVAVCFLYGVVLLALIHTTADGSWYWYAMALRGGLHLYHDLHLPLQPLYPVEVASLQSIFGVSWLAQQTVGFCNLLLFLGALFVVARSMPLIAWQRALLYCCSFLTCMGFITMRFDDFHVLATSVELFCAALLLRVAQAQRPSFRMGLVTATGLLCGACMLIRINDGGLLSCAVACAVVCMARSWTERLQFLGLLTIAAACVILLVLMGIEDSPRDWWFYSMHAAAAIKGGSNHMLLYPLRLPAGTVSEVTRDWRSLALTAYALLAGALAWLLTSDRQRMTRRQKWLLIAGLLLIGTPLTRNFIRGNAARVLVAFTVFGIYVAVALVLFRLVAAMRGRPASNWRPTELLILLPFAQLVSISLSAARWYPNTNPPAALLLILVPVALPWAFRRRQVQAVFFTWVALLTLSAGIDKLRNPFDWFNYKANSLDASRVWLHHPDFGPMLIERQQLRLMQPVCAAVRRSPPERRELLALPFTYANYFCNVAPWHGYVQTFYDISSRETISTLEKELITAPPEWIVYQQQTDVLRRNEEAFNNGRPLPHRDLDGLIIAKLAAQQWTASRLTSPAGDTSHWLLIHTAPDPVSPSR